MNKLKYTVIENGTQYRNYCDLLEKLVFSGLKTAETRQEIELLTLLIDKWDADYNSFQDLGPVALLHALMIDHGLKARDLVDILEISKGYVSDILHCKKGLSKDVIRKLATYFKLSQEAFNKPYPLEIQRIPGSKKKRVPGRPQAKINIA